LQQLARQGHDIDELKQRLIDCLEVGTKGDLTGEWLKRHHESVCTNGQHFEHLM